MSLTLDEIYESFKWEPSYTDEEYEAKISVGIEEAKTYQYIYPFIKPLERRLGTSIWEPCAKVISLKSDDELKPYLHLLFEWMQDMNWPGADIIFDRLAKMPFSMLEDEYNFCRSRAEKENDSPWLMALDDFKKEYDKNN